MQDYTRVSDDAAILCRRRDFPRAINVLQRRDPDRRRWRLAFKSVCVTGDRTLDGARRQWFVGALSELVHGIDDSRLQGELALDAVSHQTTFRFVDALPKWTARDLWNHAESVYLPMEYITRVTPLPKLISAPIDTARVVVDCRRTAEAHRNLALELGGRLPTTAVIDEARGVASEESVRLLQEIRAQQDAARRWRELAHRLFGPSGS